MRAYGNKWVQMWCFLQNSRTSAPGDFATAEWYILSTSGGEADPTSIKIGGTGGLSLQYPDDSEEPSFSYYDRRA